MPPFHVIGGPAVRGVITGARPEIARVVGEAYLAHDEGQSVLPHSSFLRFPDKPSARIIALPAFLGGQWDISGIKWVASFPTNIDHNLPRASAVLILNDDDTGYPFALLEASQINAARTAALAVLAAEELTGGRAADTIAVIGAGIIARNIVEFFAAQRWAVGRWAVHDTVPAYAQALAEHIGPGAEVAATATDAIDGADVVVFATTAGSPWLTDPATFRAGQTVLNISLRDLGPEIIAGAANVLDDVDHCLRADTSPHLAEQRYGNRDFVDGTLGQLMRRDIKLDDGRPRIFSPFGLGILDLAVGELVHRVAVEQGEAIELTDFFAEGERWRCLANG